MMLLMWDFLIGYKGWATFVGAGGGGNTTFHTVAPGLRSSQQDRKYSDLNQMSSAFPKYEN